MFQEVEQRDRRFRDFRDEQEIRKDAEVLARSQPLSGYSRVNLVQTVGDVSFSSFRSSNSNTPEQSFLWGRRLGAGARKPSPEWLSEMLAELEGLSSEAEGEGYPEPNAEIQALARKIAISLTDQPIYPTVYPTEEGGVGIFLKSDRRRSAVTIELFPDGGGACFSHINGRNQRARYADASELPDEFVRAQISALL